MKKIIEAILRFVICKVFKLHRWVEESRTAYYKAPGLDERNRYVRQVRREIDQACRLCAATRTLIDTRRVGFDYQHPARRF